MTVRARIGGILAIGMMLPLGAYAQQPEVRQYCRSQTFPQNVETIAQLERTQAPSSRQATLVRYLKCMQRMGELPAARRSNILAESAPAAAVAGSSIGNAPTQGQAAEALTKADNQSNFLGLNWGLGVGYAFGQGPRRVTATLVNNIVRVSSDVTNGPRVFLEAHYFPEKFTGKAGDFGWGPFAAVEAGAAGTTSSNGISGFGLGLMAGWRVEDNKSSGFNIGVGYLWEGNVQTLGDGIEANQPLPTGETQIRYKNQSLGAIAIMFSWTFGSSIPSSKSPGT